MAKKWFIRGHCLEKQKKGCDLLLPPLQGMVWPGCGGPGRSGGPCPSPWRGQELTKRGSDLCGAWWAPCWGSGWVSGWWGPLALGSAHTEVGGPLAELGGLLSLVPLWTSPGWGCRFYFPLLDFSLFGHMVISRAHGPGYFMLWWVVCCSGGLGPGLLAPGGWQGVVAAPHIIYQQHSMTNLHKHTHTQ